MDDTYTSINNADIVWKFQVHKASFGLDTLTNISQASQNSKDLHEAFEFLFLYQPLQSDLIQQMIFSTSSSNEK